MSGLAGAIIAAGEGRRLREAGWTVPKPLVPVAGVPLLASTIENFRAAGVESIVVIVNEQARECASWARVAVPRPRPARDRRDDRLVARELPAGPVRLRQRAPGARLHGGRLVSPRRFRGVRRRRPCAGRRVPPCSG